MSDHPQVLIMMGSESDLDVMERTADTLSALEIPFEMRVMSAHRTPAEVDDAAKAAANRGIKVLICAAGLAAHLAGAVAGKTLLPVIGVPVGGGPLSGFDALLSTVQMPPGVPVATVAVGKAGAVNAAVLAAQIIAVADDEVRGNLEAWRNARADKVRESDTKVRSKYGTGS